MQSRASEFLRFTSCFSLTACTLVMSELESGIAGVDKDKKIGVGSFRIDSHGNQGGLNQVLLIYRNSHSFAYFTFSHFAILRTSKYQIFQIARRIKVSICLEFHVCHIHVFGKTV